MIPNEAIEAAAKRISGHYGAGPNNWEWYLTEAREVLEAAAPSLMAQAWDEAAARGLNKYGADRLRAANPYRSQA